MNILQYESKIWATADLLRGCGIKESEWPSFMMPFFALAMIESRLVRMFDDLKTEIGEVAFAEIEKEDLFDLIKDKGQGYNIFIFEKSQALTDICKNDKSFEIDFDAYLKGFDGETKDLLGVDAGDGEKFLDIKGVITKLKAKKVLFSYTKLWAEIDLKPFNNSEITTLEEHIKRKWADISAETAGEQYTPDDVIALIAEIIASKIEESDTLLKIYDCTCGGGNMLFGVEDRINQKFKRLTQTYGQDWNDALYALAKIESRFRPDSKIEHGNTLVEDKFDNEEFDVVIANPPYGVSWKGYEKDITNDKTGRFKYLPSISDGQLLFMQHLISKLDSVGMGVVVHNGSTLFSGDAGQAESNIRKWMLDSDIVEAVIQLPTNEFFNTPIYTYLWILNKNKPKSHINKVMLIDASSKFTSLKKAKGDKRKEVDLASRLDIVATLTAYQNNNYARVFDKEFFYFNKQAIMLTNVDEQGRSFEACLPMKEDKFGELKRVTSIELIPTKITQGDLEMTEFSITQYDATKYTSLENYCTDAIKPKISLFDYKEQPLLITTTDAVYYYDADQETLIKEAGGKKEALGCGKILVGTNYKKATKKLAERIEISVELTADYQKDYEIIPFHKDSVANQAAIETFMARHISKPFVYLENVVGAELNFNKVFYRPANLRSARDILNEIAAIDEELMLLDAELSFNKTVTRGLDKTVVLKDSGVEWIGKVPEHWNILRGKDIFEQTKNKVGLDSSSYDVLSLSIAGIVKRDRDNMKGKIPASFDGYQITNPGDLVLCLFDMDVTPRIVGYVNQMGIITSAYTVLKGKKNVNMKYFLYYYLEQNRNGSLLANSKTLRSTMTFDLFSQLQLPVPPLEEQNNIATYLDEKTAQIDSVISSINAKIEKLKDLRKSLITDVVSGRIEVVGGVEFVA